MAEKDPRRDPENTDPDGPSLELPSLGLGRKRRTKRDVAPRAGAGSAPTDPAAPPARPEPEPTTAGRGAPLFTDEAPASSQRVRSGRPTIEQIPAAGSQDDPDESGEPGRTSPGLPQLGAVPATLVTGLLVGVITVGLVWASQRLCELLRGTSTCGNAGFLLLLAVLVAAGLLGGSLLKALGIAEGGSTSFLGMALVAVVLMLVLGDQLFAWWMVLAVPGVAMLSYLLAHRVTTAMVDPGGPEIRR